MAMNEVMCKGDAQLGTACGKCSRCCDAQRLRADTAEAELAKLREPIGWLVRNKVTGELQVAEPNEKATNPAFWTDAFKVYEHDND